MKKLAIFVLALLIFEGPSCLTCYSMVQLFLFDVEIALPLRASCSYLLAMLDLIYKHMRLTNSISNQQYTMRLIKCMRLITMCA